ncbi:hypothetical protein BCR33DRAFT_35621 [Rhizoclosmatium globosum]|uniref:EB1 C-terminal domain-containing protein n=1 Tax=Rhizoclosmatium globosum TaxID=329046 RepID=A0A1Y2CNA6_9FUNG|nr:hypothetical protein BCR33DRAFT_35621 [Rhizoclosmatium globosum]|eukprot:ORY48447.1 hypothetical protein BCR33DRAFT_35621 [Rhizoclosmatium globosum]
MRNRVPLKKVKFNAKHEYEYVANFKVLQSVFDKHRIENNIPLERLIKCKPQDNLEFMQWMKKYWDQYYPGGTYDALARRAASPTASNPSLASTSTASPTKGSASSIQTGMKKTLSTNSVSAPQPPQKRSTTTQQHQQPLQRTSTMPSAARANKETEQEYQRNLAHLQEQAMELKLTVEQVEKEREFYFGKLREIEVFVQEQLDTVGAMGVGEVLETIQSIMYKTEEGFEIPEDGEGVVDEEETF